MTLDKLPDPCWRINEYELDRAPTENSAVAYCYLCCQHSTAHSDIYVDLVWQPVPGNASNTKLAWTSCVNSHAITTDATTKDVDEIFLSAMQPYKDVRYNQVESLTRMVRLWNTALQGWFTAIWRFSGALSTNCKTLYSLHHSIERNQSMPSGEVVKPMQANIELQRPHHFQIWSDQMPVHRDGHRGCHVPFLDCCPHPCDRPYCRHCENCRGKKPINLTEHNNAPNRTLNVLRLLTSGDIWAYVTVIVVLNAE